MRMTLTSNEQRRAAYCQQGLWGDVSLTDYWQQTARTMLDKITVVDNHGALYACSAFNHVMDCLVNWMLVESTESGDRIAFQPPGWCKFTVIYLACLETGAVFVPLLPPWREAELVRMLNKCQAKMSLVPALLKQARLVDLILPLQNQLPQLQWVVSVDRLVPAVSSLSLSQIIADNTSLTTAIMTHGDELATVLFISGTEDLPEGVMLVHSNILASKRAYCARPNLTWQDVFVIPAPPGRVTGFLHGVTALFLIGVRNVLLNILTPNMYPTLPRQQHCTCMLGATPLVYDLSSVLEEQPADLSALRFFLCGGITTLKEVVHEYQQRGIKLLSVYGSTKSSSHAVVNLDGPLSRFVHIDGYAAVGVEIKMVDDACKTLPPGCEGEEASCGPNVFMGHFGEPELTAYALDEESWYHSGDLCRMDETGYIEITGRKKDIIVRGDENISSRGVEDILLQYPKIHDACVVVTPDERLGGRLCAYVVLKTPRYSLSLEEVVTFFSRKRVAKCKYLEYIVVIEKLPRTTSGKM